MLDRFCADRLRGGGEVRLAAALPVVHDRLRRDRMSAEKSLQLGDRAISYSLRRSRRNQNKLVTTMAAISAASHFTSV